MRKQKLRKQRGAALLLAIFGLVLITGVAMAMLFASDTETSISLNYRDKQVAMYAALSGLQEARARIHPLTGDLGPTGANIVPASLPAAGAPNILYIINPGANESASDIKPWDPSNKYFDTELCQENVLGLSGTPGVPCATSASGSGWYRAYDNSANNTVWQLKSTSGNRIPLAYKWVRIQLKADNSTPVTVGTTASGKQVCWDGAHEQQIGNNYHTDCTPPNDGVTNIAVTYSGSGYSLASPPTVTLTGGSGAGATATAQTYQLPSGITSTTITDHGNGYTSAPNVAVISTDGNGGGAAVTATIGGNPVNGINLQNGSTPACFAAGTTASSITVTFNPASDGVSGSVTAMTGTRCATAIAASGKCSDGTATVSGPGGFTGSIIFDTNSNQVKSTTVTNPGNFSGAQSLTNFTINCAHPGSGGNKPKVSSVSWGVQIQSATGSGGNYLSAPTVSFGGAASAGGSTKGTATLGTGTNVGKVATLKIVNPGSGYTANPTLVIDPPPAGIGVQTAAATASISPDVGIKSITVTNAGHGYTPSNPPTVSLSPATSNPATAVASVGSGGTYQGAVYLLTALAQTQTGARAMAQMEVGVTYNQFSLSLGGALNLPGPQPSFGTPNAQNFVINGKDCTLQTASCPNGLPASQLPSTCNTTPLPPKPAIAVYDDPNNPTDPTAVATVTSALGKPNNYIGAHAAPDVENAFSTFGNPTPDQLNSFVDSIRSQATNRYGSNPSSINLGSPNNIAIDVVDGDYTMGPITGYGILVVTGTLTFHGDYSWNGLILVIGSGASVMDGGGTGLVNGSVFVANTSGSTLGSPVANWSGGGGNGVQYNHCWADDMLAKVPYTPSASANALKVISMRMMQE